MQYICPNCHRQPEEIIGDDSPRCLQCGKPMLRATSSYKGFWFSPAFVIYRMKKITETYGKVEAVSNRRFKQEREAWTTAAWALGLKEMEERDYWVEIETQDNTPDTKLHRLNQSSGHNKVETYNIEVVDWEEHVDDLMQVIRQKCERFYPPYFVLLVLGRSGKDSDPNAVMQAIHGIRVPFAEIWILGRPLDDQGKVRMVRLFPEGADLRFDLSDAVKRSEKKREIMRPEQRGTGTELHARGDIYFPIP